MAVGLFLGIVSGKYLCVMKLQYDHFTKPVSAKKVRGCIQKFPD